MKESVKKSRFIRIMKMPGRALARARDLYVKGMKSYADRGCYGGLGGGPALGFQVVDPLPRSFTTNCRVSSRIAANDLDDLLRAASSRAHADTGGVRLQGVPRSASVGMAKIDEDSPCEFGVDDYRPAARL